MRCQQILATEIYDRAMPRLAGVVAIGFDFTGFFQIHLACPPCVEMDANERFQPISARLINILGKPELRSALESTKTTAIP
jgi:hypothetical protein